MSSYSSRINNDIFGSSQSSHRRVKDIVHTPTKLKSLIHAKKSGTSSKTNSLQPVYYSSLFEKVFNKRLLYFKRILGCVSVLLVALMTILSPKLSFFMIPIKVPFIFGSFIFIQSLRELTMTVDYNPLYKNLYSQIFGEVVSKKFINIFLGYFVASWCYFLVIYFQMASKTFNYYINSPTKTIKPLINDEFVFYWYHAIFVAIYYSLQHAIFLRSKLNFKFGVATMNPKTTLFKSQTQFLKISLVSMVVTILFSIISYRMLRPIIYKIFLYPIYWPLNLNHKIPLAKLSATTIFKLIMFDSILFYVWELINHIFNCYASIGCITEDKGISTLSKDPVNSLLSGLRDTKRPLVRLTAFQELAYIAVSDDPKLREFLYSSHLENGYLWTKILKECSVLLEDTSKRIKARPKVLSSSLADESRHITRPSIFGNSKTTTTENSVKSSSHYPLKSEDLVSPVKPRRHNISFVKEDMEPIDLKKFLLPVLKFLSKQYKEFMDSSVGTPFRPTLRREADTRVINPVNVGNAILSISLIMLSAEFEDKKNVVFSTLPEVLASLEKFITACSIFINNPIIEDHSKKSNSVVLLHDLAMRYFFEIVVKYNHMLDDFALSQPVFDLSKQCVDLAIEQQREQELEKAW